jgi:peptide/nickel transport system substrate-binding protein
MAKWISPGEKEGEMKPRRSWLLVLMASLFFAAPVHDGFCQQKQPQYGGTLTIIRAHGPRVLSYLPEMGPRDEEAVFPGVERIMDVVSKDGKREFVPFLAESMTVAKDGKSIAIKLRKGVRFHDGSELNAEAVAWNYQLYKDTKRLQYERFVEKIEVANPYTVILRITRYNNLLRMGLGWVPIYSKQAWDKAGGGNVEKSKEWARVNCVGTGPFKMAEHKRDNYIKWVKNEDYWQKGRPYLDAIQTRFVSDSVTASAIMQAKEADLWADPPVKDQADSEKRGFVRRIGSAIYPMQLIPATKEANAPWHDKRVREAVEYALDKPGIAKALGFGLYVPMTMVSPPGEWGFDPDYHGRTYDPAKAKKLLADAGYPNNRLKAKLLVMEGPNVQAATAIKRYLDDAGFQIDLDVADAGRFFGSVWGEGWKDLVFMNSAVDINFLVAFQRWWGHEPMSNLTSFVRPPELIKLSEESTTYEKEADQRAVTKKTVRYIADGALVIPVYGVYASYITQPWVHTDWLQQGLACWRLFDAWVEKH